MQIINELEATGRDIRPEVLDIFPSQTAWTCIIIRTIVFKDKKAISRPERDSYGFEPGKEYTETVNKAKAQVWQLRLRKFNLKGGKMKKIICFFIILSQSFLFLSYAADEA
jgi:anthranilate/para-aminobenzoate synthase component I